MATDAELIRQTLQGNERAFADLIEKYQRQILAICQQMVKNPQDAEELTQDTFLCAYQKLGQLRDREKFLSWLKQIARNQCKMYLRRETSTPVSLTDYPQLIAHQATVEEGVLHQELLDAILQAIETLPAKDQQILRAHLDGLSHAEICERTALSYRASLNRLYRARQKIKAQVRHLLSGIGALPKWFSNSKLFSGGTTIMKITTPTKITVGVFGILLVGFLGWKALHHERIGVAEVKQSLTSNPPPLVSISPSARSKEKKESSTQSKEKKEVPSSQPEPTTPTHSTDSKSETDHKIGKLGESDGNLFLSDEDLQGEKTEELSPELQRKVEIYAELASILPEYKRLWPLVLNVPAGDKNRTDSQLALIRQWGELGQRIFDLCEPFIGPPAIKRDERGVIQQVNLAPLFTQIAEHLGKELPFDGNSDFFSAEDYQGSTGGW